MVFIAMGTQKFPFNRLLRTADQLVETGQLTGGVFAQTGHSDYVPKHYTGQSFLCREAFEHRIQTCDLLITHSGVATIITGLKYEKPVIVVPRLAKYGEHVDDHQLQIARSFSEQNLVLMCGEQDDLATCIARAREHKFARYVSQRAQMVETIRDYLKTL